LVAYPPGRPAAASHVEKTGGVAVALADLIAPPVDKQRIILLFDKAPAPKGPIAHETRPRPVGIELKVIGVEPDPAYNWLVLSMYIVATPAKFMNHITFVPVVVG